MGEITIKRKLNKEAKKDEIRIQECVVCGVVSFGVCLKGSSLGWFGMPCDPCTCSNEAMHL